MPRVYIISLLVLLASRGISYGQNSLGDSLLFYEYKYFNSVNPVEKQNLLIKKISLYLIHDSTGPEVLKEIQRVNLPEVSDPSLKKKFLWNAAIIAYLNNSDNRSAFYLDQYYQLTGDTSVTYHLLLILAHKYSDTALVNSTINHLTAKDSLFQTLHCFIETANYNRRHLNTYLLSSLILPGSGAIMNGYVVKGLISLALTAGSVYGIVKLVEYGLYVNAVLWGGGVGLKFYSGNVKLTESLFYKAEAKQKNKLAQQCALKLKVLLDKYPLMLQSL